MIFTPEERRAILAVGGLLLFGQGLGVWQSWQSSRPDEELNLWLVEWTNAKVISDEAAARDSTVTKRVQPSWQAPALEVQPIEVVPPGWISSGKVRVDLANSTQLEQLPGIGPALAGRIVATRDEAPFQTMDDLLRVPGIGERTLERLRPLILLSPSGPDS